MSVKTPSRVQAVLPLLEQGRDVFIEWPFGKNITEARAFALKAREKTVRTMVGLQAWQVPAVRKIREILAGGKLGTVNNVTWASHGLAPGLILRVLTYR